MVVGSNPTRSIKEYKIRFLADRSLMLAFKMCRDIGLPDLVLDRHSNDRVILIIITGYGSIRLTR